jgi:hypothetical protein
MPFLPQRSDADLVTALSPMRRIMPYLMRGRQESVVNYEMALDLSRTLPFIARWNREHTQELTLFDVVLAACGRALHERSGLNRFVSGGRIYQRRQVHIAFAAKKSFDDEAPLVMVKLEMLAREPLLETVRRVQAAVRESRADAERPLEREIRLFTALPGAVLRRGVQLVLWLDAHNLLPEWMRRDDPMFSSLFLANLGSVGLDRAFHHLYEYGTASLFGVVGQLGKAAEVDADGVVRARDHLPVFWTFDERIHDGFYCAASLKILRGYIENPEQLEG